MTICLYNTKLCCLNATIIAQQNYTQVWLSRKWSRPCNQHRCTVCHQTSKWWWNDDAMICDLKHIELYATLFLRGNAVKINTCIISLRTVSKFKKHLWQMMVRLETEIHHLLEPHPADQCHWLKTKSQFLTCMIRCVLWQIVESFQLGRVVCADGIISGPLNKSLQASIWSFNRFSNN